MGGSRPGQQTRDPQLRLKYAVKLGADLGLLPGGSQSVVVICHSTYEPREVGGCTYIRDNISRLLILQFLH